MNWMDKNGDIIHKWWLDDGGLVMKYGGYEKNQPLWFFGFWAMNWIYLYDMYVITYVYIYTHTIAIEVSWIEGTPRSLILFSGFSMK